MLPPFKPRYRPTSNQLRWLIVVTVSLLLLFAASYSFAQTAAPAPGSTFKVLDSIQANFMGKKATWGSIVTKYAMRLFFLLAVIDFCYTALTFILDKKELEDMMFSVVRKLMTLGFFFTVLKTSNTWIPEIIDSFTQIGKEAGGATAAAGSPDGIVNVGFNAAIGVFQILGELDMDEVIVAVFPAVAMALVLFMAFLWVAAQLMIAQIETAFAVGVGVIMLGFGGSKWTTDMASKYMQYSVATGLKLMMLYVVVGVGQTLFSDLKLVSGDMFIPSLIIAGGTAMTYAFLATKVPAMASAMMSGSPALTAGDMAGAVIGAGAALAGLGAAGFAATKMAGGAAAGGAAGATGVAKALGAGMQSGMDLGKSGAGLAAHALGQVGSHGLGLAGRAIGDGVAGGKASFAQMVDQSAGGRVASSIDASRGGSMAGVAPQAPSGPSSGSSAASPTSSPAATGAADAGNSNPTASSGGAQEAAADGARSAVSAASTDAASDQPSVPNSGSADASAPDSTATTAAVNGAAAAQPTASAPVASGPASPSAATSGTGSGTAAGQTAKQSGNVAGSSGSPSATPASAPPQDAASNSAPTSTPMSALSGGEGSPLTGSAPMGDASSGAVTGGENKRSSGRDGYRRDPLHERLKGLQGYLPQDGDQAATVHIDLKHSE
jgi:type IV secretion system protein TrbL